MISKEDLERLYLVEHRTMQEIGELLGCTRQNVFFQLRKYSIDKSNSERFNTICDTCGVEFSITRKRYRTTQKHFCSKGCYTKWMHSPGYLQNRTGQRTGRRVFAERTGHTPCNGEVIHHKDGNDLNNDFNNLMLFKDHSEHMKYHHEVRRSGS